MSPTRSLKVGEVYRVPRPKAADQPQVDGLPNLFHLTLSEDGTTLPTDSGINPVASPSDRRCAPAIILRSSPHKAGSVITPWDDVFDVDRGYVRYFGDNKPEFDGLPHESRGNARMLDQFSRHRSRRVEERRTASPIVIIRGVPLDGRIKGQVEFVGLAVMTSCELVMQAGRDDSSFANYVFELAVLDLSAEGDRLDWRWINDRRNPGLKAEDIDRRAPSSWRRWIELGNEGVEKFRRRVARQRIISPAAQTPVDGSREDSALEDVRRFYREIGRRHRFEAVAAAVASHALRDSGLNYTEGWITPGSSDGGTDFVGRIDVGSGFGSAQLVVLGQAKCEKAKGGTTSGRDIARLVARLRRGWFGVYVTTATISKMTQMEMIEDEYPVRLINGEELGRRLSTMAFERGIAVGDLIAELDSDYDDLISFRRPETIVHMSL